MMRRGSGHRGDLPVPDQRQSAANFGHISKQLRMAKERGADVAHFPEGALSG